MSSFTGIISENLVFTETMLNYKEIEADKHKLESYRSNRIMQSFFSSDDGFYDTISIYFSQYQMKTPSIAEKD